MKISNLTTKLSALLCVSFFTVCILAKGQETGADVKQPLLIDVPENFPESLKKMHLMVQQKLVEFEKDGEEDSEKKLIISYGKKLSAKVKSLTKQRKIKEAVAVKVVRDDLLRIYNSKQKKKNKASSVIIDGIKQIDLIKDGRAHKLLDFERKEWKRSAKYLKSTGAWKKMRMKDYIVGDGDFTVRLVIKVASISGVGPELVIGETQFRFDAEDTKMRIKYGAYIHGAKEGKKLAGVVSAKNDIEWIIKRTGEDLTMLVDGKEMFKEKIHPFALGRVRYWASSPSVAISQLSVEGNLTKSLVDTNLVAWSRRPTYHYRSTQWLNFGDDSRTYVMTGHKDNEDHSIYIKHSNNREDRDAKVTVLESNKGDGRYLKSLSTATNTETGGAHMLYAEGKFNQQIYYKYSRNKGKVWTKGKKITNLLKDDAWDVRFDQSGLVKRVGKNEGKVMFSFIGGKEKKGLYLAISDRNQLWRRVGPIMEDCEESSITEMPSGELLIVSRYPNSNRVHGGIRMKWSKDGGETWGDEMAWKEKVVKHSTRVISFPTKENPDLLLMTGEEYNNIQANLYFSLDRGKTWSLLTRIENARSVIHQLYRVDENKILITMRHDRGHNDRVQVRSHELNINDFELK